MTCHDCKVEEGYYHISGCDMEMCPKCGGQIISCDCKNEEFEDMERIPWICYPNMCVKCGKLWPALFYVSNEEWEKYVEPAQRNSVLCFDCFQNIRELIDICIYGIESKTPFIQEQAVRKKEEDQHEPDEGA